MVTFSTQKAVEPSAVHVHYLIKYSSVIIIDPIQTSLHSYKTSDQREIKGGGTETSCNMETPEVCSRREK